MEKPIDARTAKLKAMDKIMDKVWKTLRGLPHLTHNFDHSLQQAFLSLNDLFHKLHNNYYFCWICYKLRKKETLYNFQLAGGIHK
jgi:hypothetical protein